MQLELSQQEIDYLIEFAQSSGYEDAENLIMGIISGKLTTILLPPQKQEAIRRLKEQGGEGASMAAFLEKRGELVLLPGGQAFEQGVDPFLVEMLESFLFDFWQDREKAANRADEDTGAS